jgi:glycosidase
VHTTNIYEVNLRQYTRQGSFAAFAKHLPRLKDMGVEIIWLMPITPISVQNRKGTLGSYYACNSYVQTNPEFGTVADFKVMVNQIHTLGMKVIIDWVANHTGWDHEWTKSNPDFYEKNGDGSFRPPVESWEDVIKLNFSNQAMRTAMIDAMKFWVNECGIDGFRCDMAMLVPFDFWTEARKHLDAAKKLFWLGEFDVWNDEMYGHVFDVSYSWHWMHVSHEYVQKHRRMLELDKALSGYRNKQPYHHMLSFFTSNHDENSWNGTEYEKYGEMALPLAVFSCLYNGIPLLYSGQELPNHKRLEFFDKDEIEWTETISLHTFYKTLLTIRKQHPALLTGHLEVITWRIATDKPNALFCFLRKNKEREVLVVLNFSDEQQNFHLHDMRVRGHFRNMFTGRQKELAYNTKLSIEPWGWRVWEK